MGTIDSRSFLRFVQRDQRGAVYVEHVLAVAVGLLIAVTLAEAGALFVSRFGRIDQVLYSGVP